MQRGTRRGLRILALALMVLTTALVWQIHARREQTDEVILKLGEPYEQMRQRSRSSLPPRGTGSISMASVIAKFRFDDPVYGFTTPAAVFSQMGLDDSENSNVASVQLSPQMTALPLDEAIAIVMDIQDQLRRSGWRAFQYSYWRPIENTPVTRRAIGACKDPMSVWNGGDKYQVTLDVRCFSTQMQPGQERYVVTLELGPPFYKDAAGTEAAH
ncbi:MAG TPA: flagellar biosynthesis sigma factor [Paraburkholderia sp.]